MQIYLHFSIETPGSGMGRQNTVIAEGFLARQIDNNDFVGMNWICKVFVPWFP
jgi:hypothetical protein